MNPAPPTKKSLHLVVRSRDGALDDCRSRFSPGDAVLFLDDGVMHITGDQRDSFEPSFAEWYFSAFDLNARGLSGLAAGASAIMLTDKDIVELLRRFELCLTWK